MNGEQCKEHAYRCLCVKGYSRKEVFSDSHRKHLTGSCSRLHLLRHQSQQLGWRRTCQRKDCNRWEYATIGNLRNILGNLRKSSEHPRNSSEHSRKSSEHPRNSSDVFQIFVSDVWNLSKGNQALFDWGPSIYRGVVITTVNQKKGKCTGSQWELKEETSIQLEARERASDEVTIYF